MRIALLLLLLAAPACKHHEVVERRRHHGAAITVTTALPGASATTIASSVTTPLERQFGQMPHLEQMTSHSIQDKSTIVLDFADGTDSFTAAGLVQQAINASAALLPRTLPAPPTYFKVGDSGAVLRVTLSNKAGATFAVMSRSTDEIAQKLAQVSGVGRVSTCGDATERVAITLDPVALRESGKTIDDVLTALRDPAVDLNALDAPSSVRDVAKLVHTTAPPACLALEGGDRVVAITVEPQPDADAPSVRDRLEGLLRALARTLPSEIVIDTLPRTRPIAYELAVDSDQPITRRIDDVRAFVSELPGDSISKVLAQLGANDENAVDLRIVPKPDGDADAIDAAVRKSAANHGFAVRSRSDYIVGMSGADAKPLALEVDKLVRALAADKALHATPIGTRLRSTLALQVDRDVAARLGIRADTIDRQLSMLGDDGGQISTLFTQVDAIPVMLSVERDPNVPLTELLSQLDIRTAGGSVVPMAQLVTANSSPEPLEVIHEGQFPWLGVRVHGSLDDIEAVLAALPVPADMRRTLREAD